MTNNLINSNSPYLLQHADNPVDWYPWEEAALETAKREDKPIFLSIGYAACHWCHVMAHESFEDPETARIMNENFVNIKVDREERPDLEQIYMNAVVSLTGQGGWPMSVFLTPEGVPFYGGTYFPPVPRYNMPSFRDVLLRIARAWREDRQRLLQAGEQIAEQIQATTSVSVSAGKPLNPLLLDQAAMGLAQSYDWKAGGWGRAPKFPQPMAIEFLLRRATRGDRLARDIATHVLDAMAKGGMYDIVGGGFARYSTDNNWLVPHFEKMLYDNAQLAKAYLHAFLITGEDRYRRVCIETLDFVVREMTDPQGGFFSSLDADSEGEEGKFYVWTPVQIRTAFEDPSDAEFYLAAFGVTESGNFEGKNILQRVLDDESLAAKFGIKPEQLHQQLDRLNARLLELRGERVRPGTDDKILVSWNGLMLSAFSEAARYLEREDHREVATRNAGFLLENLQMDGRLLRSWREGRAKHNAYLEDYASLILGLLALYQTDPDVRWFSAAEKLTSDMIAHFHDPAGGFFDTRDDHEQLITRPKDLQDNATPSGNSLAVTALLKMSAFTGLGDWRDLAESNLSIVQDFVVRYPTAFSQWLYALDFALTPAREVAILTEDLENATAHEMLVALWSEYRPNLVAAISTFPPPPEAPALLKERPLIDNRTSAYVCQNFVCNRPVNTVEEFRSQLKGSNIQD